MANLPWGKFGHVRKLHSGGKYVEVDRVFDRDRFAQIFGRLDRLSRIKSSQTIDSVSTKRGRLDRLTRLALVA